MAGDGGILQIHHWDAVKRCYRIAAAHIKEDGIEPNKKYVLNPSGKFVPAP